MLDFGFSEIVLTSFIALIVLGPEKLPKVARQVGNWMGRARVMARQLTEQLEREVTAEELLRASEGPKSRREAIAQQEADPPRRQDLAHDALIAPATAPATPPIATEAPPVDPATPAGATALEPPPSSSPAETVDLAEGLPASQTTAAAMHASDPPSPAAHHDIPTA